MKTFEEKWTAWLDDQLAGEELAAFEASLPDRAAAEAEKRDAKKLGAFLKKELGASLLTNEDFFSHQLKERIAREDGNHDKASRPRSTWWTVPRLVWSGAAALAMFVVFAVVVVRNEAPEEQSDYQTKLLNARLDTTVNPYATVTPFESNDEQVTVLWTEGLQSLPADYAAR